MTIEKEVVDVVDEDDNVIGTIFRKDEIFGKHILRSASIFLINDKNEILLQLRSKNSKHYPLHWDVSGGGHVNSGESYEECAKRELFEETGIRVDNLRFLGKHHFVLNGKRKRINSIYISKISSNIKTNTTKVDINEVAQIQWICIPKIKKMLKNNIKFHPECEFLLNTYIINMSLKDTTNTI